MELRPVPTLPNLEDRYIWLKFEKYVLKNKSLKGPVYRQFSTLTESTLAKLHFCISHVPLDNGAITLARMLSVYFPNKKVV